MRTDYPDDLIEQTAGLNDQPCLYIVRYTGAVQVPEHTYHFGASKHIRGKLKRHYQQRRFELFKIYKCDDDVTMCRVYHALAKRVQARHENGDKVMMPDTIVTPKIYEYTCLLYTSPSPRDRQKSRM